MSRRLKLNSLTGIYAQFKVIMALLMGPLVLSSTLTACGKFSVDPKLGSVTPSVSANPATAEAENQRKLEAAKKAAKEGKDAAVAADAAAKSGGASGATGNGKTPSEMADLFAKDPSEAKKGEEKTPADNKTATAEKAGNEVKKDAAPEVAKAVVGSNDIKGEELAQAARQAELQRLEEKKRTEDAATNSATTKAVSADPAAAANAATSPEATAGQTATSQTNATEAVASEVLELRKKIVEMSDLRTAKLLLGELSKKGINPQRAKLAQIKKVLDGGKSLDSADAEWLMNLRTEYQLTDGVSIDGYLERVDVWPASLVITLAAATKPGVWGGDSEAEIARDKAVLAKVIEDLNVSTKESVMAARKIRAEARAAGKLVEAEALVAALAPEVSIALGKPVTEKQLAELLNDSKVNVLSDREASVLLAPRHATDADGKEAASVTGTLRRETNP